MAKNVIVYTSPKCPHCSTAKTYLLEQGIKFTEYDVSANKEKAKELWQKTGRSSVPVIEIDGVLIVGFDRKRIEMALEGALQRPELKNNMLFDPFDQ